METLGSLNLNHDSLFCQIRAQWLKSTPEEVIRQRCLHFMINNLGYPRAQIVLEKGLKQMPHLALKKNLPRRRADILCFSNHVHSDYGLYPLLLVECKAVKLTKKVINQVTSYNHFLGAAFVAVINADEVKTGWYDCTLEEYVFSESFFSYSDLINLLREKLKSKF